MNITQIKDNHLRKLTYALECAALKCVLCRSRKSKESRFCIACSKWASESDCGQEITIKMRAQEAA